MTEDERIIMEASEEAKRKRRSRADAEESKDWKAKKIFKDVLKEVMNEESIGLREAGDDRDTMIMKNRRRKQ